MHIPREHPPGIANGLAPGQLQLVAAENDGRRPELRNSNLKRHPGTRRRLLEYERDGASGQRLNTQASGASGLELKRTLEQAGELAGRELTTGEEVRWVRGQEIGALLRAAAGVRVIARPSATSGLRVIPGVSAAA